MYMYLHLYTCTCTCTTYTYVHAATSEQVKPKPKPVRPSPPPRNDPKKMPNKSQHSILSQILKKSPLIRAKSMEDILSSSKADYDEIPRQHSPPIERKALKQVPPPLPPPRVPGLMKKQGSVEATDGPKTTMLPKPKPGYFKTAKNQKQIANGHLPSRSRRTESPPPSSQSPTSPPGVGMAPQSIGNQHIYIRVTKCLLTNLSCTQLLIPMQRENCHYKTLKHQGKPS